MKENAPAYQPTMAEIELAPSMERVTAYLTEQRGLIVVIFIS